MAGEANGVFFELGSLAFERHPPEGVTSVLAVGYSPVKLVFAGGSAFVGVLLSDFLDGTAADKFKGGGASLAKLVEVVAGEVFPMLSPVVPVCLVAVIPDGIGFSGHPAEEGVCLSLTRRRRVLIT